MRSISVNDLTAIFKLLLAKLKFEGEEKIEIDTDLYRYIPTSDWCSFEKDVIEAGSLYDDIDSLKRLLSDKNRMVTYVDFVRVASLLRAISQKNNPI